MVLLALPPGGSSSDRKRSRPIRAFSATPRDGQRRCRTLLKIPAESSPELLISGAAAQTRVVSMAAIRLGSWESARAFKGIICDDISEFESHMPSHAVGLPQVRSPMGNLRAQGRAFMLSLPRPTVPGSSRLSFRLPAGKDAAA